jgi:hypothetical protein
MPISRMQQPRQLYGLGSIVKKIGKAAKKVVKSDLGKAALLYGATMGIPGTSFKGFGGGLGNFFGRGSFNPLKMMGTTLPGQSTQFTASPFAKFLGTNIGKASIIGGASLLGGLSADAQQDVAQLRKSGDQGLLRGYLKRYYENLNPQGEDEEDTAYEAKVSEFVRANMARGGDTAEENAIQAAGIEGLPLNQNPAGITELDLRETGGFIPPVGVKEKADDIPAMLSNNEFVFTAKAVKEMGDGDVNKGAQRMYDMMKKLENGGRV